jgi:glutamine amidotransferase
LVRVSILDYGTSNLLSVVRAFRHIGADVHLIDRADQISGAGHLIVPGVGAFGACMGAMNASGFSAGVIEHIRKARPFLGICVGMQMMFDASEEFGRNAGLGIIPGMVRSIPPLGVDGRTHRIPHIGWYPLAHAGSTDWSTTPLRHIDDDTSFYFVHSFMGMPEDPNHVLAVSDYDGIAVTAAVHCKNAFGCQFHPEKSGPAGLRFLEDFLKS